jgi:WD40 repeat protein/serine/threonine protein kinase
MSPLLKSVRSGRSITLTKKLASSGEGTVWTTNLPGFLAKLYHTATEDRIQKLRIMVDHPPQNPMRHHHHVTFAWPQDLIQDETGQCLGFLMPEIVDGVKLSIVYNPKLRSRKAPRFNWYYLHTAALNFALALKSLHEESYVVGDIKPQNLLVNNRALISVIDTDSFQVIDPNTKAIYRCLVGSEGFTPAELLGKDLATLDQTEVHDRFRLGVMVYLLLFGDQPFKGKWVGRGESPQPTDLIRDGFWPYASNSMVQPGPNTIPLSIIHPQLQVCFQRCFTEGHRNPYARPSAQDWSEALKLAIADLRTCHLENNHFYSRTYGRCYWCDRLSAVRFDVFSPIPAANRVTPSPRKTVSPQRFTRTAPAPKGIQAGLSAMTATSTLQGMSLKGKTALNPSGASGKIMGRWSHPVVWGTGCIAVGLMGLTLLLLPDLNMESIQKGGELVETTIDRWIQPSNFKDKTTAILNPGGTTKSASLMHGGHWEAITALDISPDDRLLVSGSKDMTVKVWNFPSGQLQQTFAEQYEPIISVAMSDDKETLTTSILSGKVFIWSLATASLVRSFTPSSIWEGPEDSIRASATDRQGQLIASSGWGGAILLQHLQSGKVIKIPSNSLASGQALAVLPNGQSIVSSNSNGKFQIWDANTGSLVKTFPNAAKGEALEPISTMTLNRAGTVLVSGSWYGSLVLWDLATGKMMKTLPKQNKPISTIAINDRSDQVATVTNNDTRIQLWDVKAGRSNGILKGHTSPVSALKFSHNGNFLISGGEESSIKIWDLAQYRLLRSLVQ